MLTKRNVKWFKSIISILRPGFIIFAIVVITQVAFVAYSGYGMGGDSVDYSDWADELIAQNFNYPAFLSDNINDNRSHAPLAFRLGFITIVAFAKLFMDSNWAYGIFSLNIIFGGLTAVMLAGLIYKLTKSNLARWTSGFLYITCFEIFQWARQMLSDSIFMFLAFLIFYLVADLMIRNNSSKDVLRWIVVLLLFIFIIFFRPTAILLLTIVIPGLFFWYTARNKASLQRYRLVGTAVFAILIVSIILLQANVVREPELWSDKLPFGEYVRSIAGRYADGEVIHDRPYTYHNPPSSLLEYILITLDKFIYFFAFTTRGFSFRHNLVNSIYFIPLYALILVSICALKYESNNRKKLLGNIVRLSMLFIFLAALFHAMTVVDFTWRYRLPIMPHFIFLASIGMFIVENFLMERSKPKANSQL